MKNLIGAALLSAMFLAPVSANANTFHLPKDPHQEIGALAGALIGGYLGYKYTNREGDGLTKQIIITAAGALAGGYAGSALERGAQHYLHKDKKPTHHNHNHVVYKHHGQSV